MARIKKSLNSNNNDDDVIESTPRRNLQVVAFTTIGIVAALVFIWVISTAESLSEASDGTKTEARDGWNINKIKGGGGNTKAADAICSLNCNKRRGGGTNTNHLLDRQELLNRASEAKEQLLDKLRIDYGEYFDPMFVDKENDSYRPVRPITESGKSFERLKRKLMIKVLTMQSKLRSLDSNYNGCDCFNGNDKALRNDVVDLTAETDTTTETETTFGKYVWATGGHSAAAGHGNLFNESYTAYMERDLIDVFGSIGLEFEGRNYAMGGTSSGPEISMCFKEVFGQDVDFFSWDYGMTDGKDSSKMQHFLYRGGISPGRPALMMLKSGGRSRKDREDRHKSLENIGLPAFYGADDSTEAMRNAIPSSGGIPLEDIDKLPEYVRNFKCGDSIEKGDPLCGKEKYTSYICSKRGKQTGWHPGFKSHASDGHGMALFLMEALLSTLKDLSEHQIEDIDTLLSQLNQEEDELFTNITNAELPDRHNSLLNQDALKEKIDTSLIFKGPSMCHTARLPSQTRYLGYLTETDMVGGPAPYKHETYYIGFDQKIAAKSLEPNGTLPLVYEINKEREECSGDIVTVKPDYPDFFYATERYGWTKITFPNEAEKNAYGYDPNHYKGIIILHMHGCPWGKCPANRLDDASYIEKKWEMKINGQSVSALKKLGGGASVAIGENGLYFSPNSDGQYVIETKTNEPKSFVRISSFVLY